MSTPTLSLRAPVTATTPDTLKESVAPTGEDYRLHESQRIARMESLAETYVDELKKSINEVQPAEGEKAASRGNRSETARILKELQNQSKQPENEGLLKIFNDRYDLISDIQNNAFEGERIANSFLQEDIFSARCQTADSDHKKAELVSELLKSDCPFDTQFKKDMLDNLLSKDDYNSVKSIAGIYASRNPDQDLRSELKAQFPDIDSRIQLQEITFNYAEEVREFREELKQLREENKKLLSRLEGLDNKPEESPAAAPVPPAGAAPIPSIASRPGVTHDPTFPPIDPDLIDEARQVGLGNLAHDSIRFAGLRKFKEQMEALRNSGSEEDKAKFTLVMRAESFEIAEQKYDLMMGEIYDKTVRSAVNNSSVREEKRIELLRHRLELKKQQYENMKERGSTDSGQVGSSGFAGSQRANNSGRFSGSRQQRNRPDARTIRLQRLENQITNMETRLGDMEARYEHKRSMEDQGIVTSPYAYQIQKGIFERYEEAGYFNRAPLPNPSNDLKELAEAMANPQSYELNFDPVDVRRQKVEARREEYRQQREAEAQAKREAARQNAIDMARRDFESSRSARGVSGHQASMRFSRAPKFAKDAVLEEHFSANPVTPMSRYEVSPAVARSIASDPGRVNFLAGSGEYGREERAAIRRSLARSGQDELLETFVERTIDPKEIERQVEEIINQPGPQTGSQIDSTAYFYNKSVDRLIDEMNAKGDKIGLKTLRLWKDKSKEISEHVTEYKRLEEAAKSHKGGASDYYTTFQLQREKDWLLYNSQSRIERNGELTLSEMPKRDHFKKAYSLIDGQASQEIERSPDLDSTALPARDVFNQLVEIEGLGNSAERKEQLQRLSRQIQALTPMERATYMADVRRAYETLGNDTEGRFTQKTERMLNWMHRQIDNDPHAKALYAYRELRFANDVESQNRALDYLSSLPVSEQRNIYAKTEQAIQNSTLNSLSSEAVEALYSLRDQLELSMSSTA